MTLLHAKIKNSAIHPFIRTNITTGIFDSNKQKNNIVDVDLDFISKTISVSKQDLEIIPKNLYYEWYYQESLPTGIMTIDSYKNIYIHYLKIHEGLLTTLENKIVYESEETIKRKINSDLDTICKLFKYDILIVPYKKYTNLTIAKALDY